MAGLIERAGLAVFIAERLDAGDDPASIAQQCRSRGAVLGSGAIQAWAEERARRSTIVVERPASAPAVAPTETVETAPSSAVRVIEPRGQSGRGLVELVRDMIQALDEIARNQLAIVAACQQRYMDGETDQHPTKELQGLNVVKDILKSLRAFSEAEFQLPGRRIELPPITDAASLHAALEAVREAAAEGRLTKSEAAIFLLVIEKHADTLALQLAERRIVELERRLRVDGPPILEARIIPDEVDDSHAIA